MLGFRIAFIACSAVRETNHLQGLCNVLAEVLCHTSIQFTCQLIAVSWCPDLQVTSLLLKFFILLFSLLEFAIFCNPAADIRVYFLNYSICEFDTNTLIHQYLDLYATTVEWPLVYLLKRLSYDTVLVTV